MPEPSTTSSRFGAVILAGGMSQRMGTPKALLDFDGAPLICRLVQSVQQVAAIAGVIVVTGHEPNRIREAVSGLRGVSFIHNPHYQRGEMLSSVKAGVNAVCDGWDGFFLMLLDQPAIKASTLSAMTAIWPATRSAVLIPTHDHRHGHPLLIASRCVGAISNLAPTQTLRDFVTQHRDHTQEVPVNDPGVLSDVDTMEDYQQALQLWRQRR